MKHFILTTLMVLLFCRAHSQCPGVYGLYKLTSPSVLRVYSYEMNSLVNIEPVNLSSGSVGSVFIDHKAQYIVNGPSCYYIIDALYGKVTDSLPMPDSGYTMLAPAYDPVSDKIYGVYFKGGQEYFASVNTTTKATQVYGVLPGVTGIANHSSTFNSRTNQYIVGTNLGVLVVNASTGAVDDTLPVVTDFNHVQYDSAYNKLYGVYFTGGKEYLGSYDFGTQTFATVGMLTGVTGTHYSSYNELDHRYVLGCNLGTIDIDVNTATYNVLAGVDQITEIQYGRPALPVTSIYRSNDTLYSTVKGINHIWVRNGEVLSVHTPFLTDLTPGNYRSIVQLPNMCFSEMSDEFTINPPPPGCPGIYGLYNLVSPSIFRTYNYGMDSVLNIAPVKLSSGSVASLFIDHKAQYIVNGTSYYYTIDAIYGTLLDSLPMPEPGYTMLAPGYSRVSNKIYGVYFKGGQEYFASINPTTKASQVIGVLAGVTGIANHSSTFNTRNNQYIVGTNLGVLVVNTATGAVVDTLAVVTGFNHVQYDSVYNKLYGVYFTGGKEYIGSYDFGTQTFETVGMLTGVTGTHFSSYNKYEHKYLLGCNLGTIDIDVNTAAYNVMAGVDQLNEIQFGVPALPVASIYSSNDTLYSSLPGTDYIWRKDGSVLPVHTSFLIPQTPGSYTVELKLPYGCITKPSAAYIVQPPLSGCVGIYGVYRSGPPTRFKVYDYGLDSVIDMGPVALGNGFTGAVFIDHKAQYIVNHNNQYYIIDALQGVVIDSLPMPEAGFNMIAPAYDPASDKIYGVYSKASKWYVGSINTATKATQVFGIIPNVTGISNHSSTFNTRLNQYIVGTNLGPASINAANGTLIDFIPTPVSDFNHVQYDSLYNKLYGVYFSGGKEYLGYFNFANFNFVTVGQLTGVTGTAFSTYNKLQHKYILGSNKGVINIDVNSATYNVLMPDGEMSEIQFGMPALPTPVISALPGDSFTVDLNGAAYLWFNNSVLLSENTKTIHVTAAGDYTAAVKFRNGCLSNLSVASPFPPVTGVNEAAGNETLKIYPNPSSDNMLHVVVPGSVKSGAIYMYDMSGREVLLKQIHHSGDQVIDLEGLAKGIYFIQIKNGTGASFNAKYIRQ